MAMGRMAFHYHLCKTHYLVAVNGYSNAYRRDRAAFKKIFRFFRKGLLGATLLELQS